MSIVEVSGPDQPSRYSDSLWAWQSGERIPVRAKFSAPAQTDTGAHQASHTMGTGSFAVVNRPGRGVNHPHPGSRGYRKSRAIPLLPLWAFVACSRVNFIFTFLQSKYAPHRTISKYRGRRKFFVLFLTGLGAYPASYTMGTEPFFGGKTPEARR
jgi:hypothetical protein